jgi:hypothetical protein
MAVARPDTCMQYQLQSPVRERPPSSGFQEPEEASKPYRSQPTGARVTPYSYRGEESASLTYRSEAIS